MQQGAANKTIVDDGGCLSVKFWSNISLISAEAPEARDKRFEPQTHVLFARRHVQQRFHQLARQGNDDDPVPTECESVQVRGPEAEEEWQEARFCALGFHFSNPRVQGGLGDMEHWFRDG